MKNDAENFLYNFFESHLEENYDFAILLIRVEDYILKQKEWTNRTNPNRSITVHPKFGVIMNNNRND